MDNESRYPLESKFIFDGKMVWFFVYPDTEMDMVTRDLTDKEIDELRQPAESSDIKTPKI